MGYEAGHGDVMNNKLCIRQISDGSKKGTIEVRSRLGGFIAYIRVPLVASYSQDMPLPNATYTLQGQPRPGEPMYSRPKHGMLLRLSAEATNALQSDPSGKPSVDFVVAEDGSVRDFPFLFFL